MGSGQPVWRCVKLQPENLKRVWAYVRFGVMRSCPPHVPMRQERVREVLGSLLAGRAQCWLLYCQGDDGLRHLHAMLVSTIELEKVARTRFLNLWAMFAFRHSPPEGWQVMRAAVEEFGRGQGCASITAITVNPKAAELAMSLGGSQFSLMVKEL